MTEPAAFRGKISIFRRELQNTSFNLISQQKLQERGGGIKNKRKFCHIFAKFTTAV